MVVHVRRAAAITSGLAWPVTVYGLVIRPWHLGALVRRIADLARLVGVVIHARIGMQMRLLCARRSVGSTRDRCTRSAALVRIGSRRGPLAGDQGAGLPAGAAGGHRGDCAGGRPGRNHRGRCCVL